MYETYFNLTDRPFASVPRTDHYYPAGVIDAARNTLTRTIDRGEGVGLIVGPPGTGKSLLCQVLAEHFQARFQVALLACTHLDTRRALLQAVLYELNRPYRGMDEGELRLALVDYLALNDDCAGGMLLVVDEAHYLPLRLLEEIRALTNVTRAMQPAVRLVLAGNHLVEERFANPKLESLSQRISARCYLEAFRSDETQAYIWARIMVSSGRGSEIFPADTCRMVHKATGGVPRLINQLCDHVLLLAYASGVRCIEPAHVEEAWADMQQLPTPWNAAATAPAADNVIEFGGLDDSTQEMSPIAGRISGDCPDFRPPPCSAGDEAGGENGNVPLDAGRTAAAQVVISEEAPAELAESAAVADVPMDAETSRQLRKIQRLLADVQAEFMPGAADAPQLELGDETPHPFEEPFEEEEVIAERYPVAATSVTAAVVATPNPEPTATTAAVTEAPVIETEPQAETIPITSQTAPAETIAEHHPALPPRSVVPPPKKEFRRLFAKLRQGI